MNGREYLERLVDIVGEGDSLWDSLSYVVRSYPIVASPEDVALLRTFFSNPPPETLKKAIEHFIERLKSLPDLDDSSIAGEQSEPDQMKILIGRAAFIKSEILTGDISFDHRTLEIEDWFRSNVIRYGENVFGFGEFVRRSVEVGTVVTCDELPKDLRTYIAETSLAYSLGQENAACALARTCLERAMSHICDEYDLWDKVKLLVDKHDKRKAETIEKIKENIYTEYPPFCLMMAVTGEGTSLHKKVKKLYNRFSRLLHGKQLISNDGLKLVRDAFDAVERLYDRHYL